MENMENSSTTAPHQQPSTGFGIDASSIGLAKIFSACLHCVERATECLREQNHPDTLKFSLLRLRMSRLGEHHHLYQEPIPNFLDRADDVAAAKESLSQLLSLLDVDSSESDGLSGNEKSTSSNETSPSMLTLLLDKLDTISMGRWAPVRDLPSCRRLREYQGHVSWTTTQYNAAANIVLSLEGKLGSNDLRDLSSCEQEKIESEGFDVPTYRSLYIAAETMDPWVELWVRPIVERRVTTIHVLGRAVNVCNDISFSLPQDNTETRARKRDQIHSFFSGGQ